MSVKKIRTNCGKCQTQFVIPFDEIPLHILDQEGDAIILCPSCCKKKYWYEKDRCDKCSEKNICEGKFKINVLQDLQKITGL